MQRLQPERWARGVQERLGWGALKYKSDRYVPTREWKIFSWKLTKFLFFFFFLILKCAPEMWNFTLKLWKKGGHWVWTVVKMGELGVGLLLKKGGLLLTERWYDWYQSTWECLKPCVKLQLLKAGTDESFGEFLIASGLWDALEV